MQVGRIETLESPVRLGLDDELVNVLNELDGLGDQLADAGSEAPAASNVAPGTRILIADDSSFTRYGLRKLLVEHGYEVFEAEGGTRAIQLYKEKRPDAVLLDITMPDLDGLTALRQIRRMDPQARVVMVTGMGQQTIVMQAIQHGASDFVVKPFESARVLAAVQKLVAS
jgi:two-component system chemotaxis response regulator CheY